MQCGDEEALEMTVHEVSTRIKALQRGDHLVTLYIRCDGRDLQSVLEWVGHRGTGRYMLEGDGESLTIYDEEDEDRCTQIGHIPP